MHKIQLKNWQIISIILFLIIALLSATVVGKFASSPAYHRDTLQILDDQKMDAMMLTVTVTAASTAISTLPDDAASPIADELADLATPLFLIVCILYLEKFLATTFGWVAFTFLVPSACIIACIYILHPKEKFFVWVKKLLILSLALILVIPTSAQITKMVEDTYSETVKQTFEAAYELSNETKEEGSNAFLAFFTNLADNISQLIEKAKNMLSVMVDAVAVLLITSCAIPLLTALVFIQITKKALNVDIPVQRLLLLSVQRKKRKQEELPENDF